MDCISNSSIVIIVVNVIITVAALKTATSATATITVPYDDTDCGVKDRVGYAVEQNLQQELPCFQQGVCVVDVQSDCDVTASSRRKRSGGSVSVTVTLTADFGDSITLDESKLWISVYTHA